MSVITDLSMTFSLGPALGVALIVYFVEPFIKICRGVGMDIMFVLLGSNLGHTLIRLIFAVAFGAGAGFLLS